MNETWLHPEEIARLKNLLYCTWIGLLYGICAVAVTSASWSVFFLIVALVSGSNYLGVGRRSLQGIAPVALFVTLLALFGLLPTAEDLRIFANSPMAWLRSMAG
jgi:hypothetical protein